MSVTLYRSQVLTKKDLNVYLLDEAGHYFDPFSITYTVYKVISDRFYNQECGEEPLLETIDTIPIPFGIGKYFAAWKQAKDLEIGRYRIKWQVRRYSDSPIFQEIEEFDIINKVDQLTYSCMNGGATGPLPHDQFGNENVCAG